MTVGLKTWDCLQSIDSNESATATTTTTTTSPATTTTNNSGSTTNLNTIIPAKMSNENFNNLINNFEPIASATSSSSATLTQTVIPNETSTSSTHNLGALKKYLRGPPKSGRNHAGAKYLASQYTTVKRIYEFFALGISIPLIFFNLYYFLFYFDIRKWYFIFPAASKYFFI